MVKTKECVVVEDNGKYTAGYFDITKSIELIIGEREKCFCKICAGICSHIKHHNKSKKND